MTNAENIASLVQLKPDYLGFIFYPKSPRHINSSLSEKIDKLVPRSITRVGVFVNEVISELILQTSVFNIKTVQLHGSEDPGYCRDLKDLGFTVIKAFGVNDGFDFNMLNLYQHCCDYFLFDTKSEKHGGTGKKFNWEKLSEYDNSKPLFLSGGIGPDDVASILELTKLNIHALDLNSRFETSAGIKDIKKLETFISQIRTHKR